MLDENTERLAKAVVDCAFKVHFALGPGLLEKVYEACLAHELTKSGFGVRRQLKIPIKYDGVVLDEGLRLDILVEEKIIVEIKAVEQMNRLWESQIISHLKLTGKQIGFLINFNVPYIKNGIKRFVNTRNLRNFEL